MKELLKCLVVFGTILIPANLLGQSCAYGYEEGMWASRKFFIKPITVSGSNQVQLLIGFGFSVFRSFEEVDTIITPNQFNSIFLYNSIVQIDTNLFKVLYKNEHILKYTSRNKHIFKMTKEELLEEYFNLVENANYYLMNKPDDEKDGFDGPEIGHAIVFQMLNYGYRCEISDYFGYISCYKD